MKCGIKRQILPRGSSPKIWIDIADRISPTISLNSVDKLLINGNEYEKISTEARKSKN